MDQVSCYTLDVIFSTLRATHGRMAGCTSLEPVNPSITKKRSGIANTQ